MSETHYFLGLIFQSSVPPNVHSFPLDFVHWKVLVLVLDSLDLRRMERPLRVRLLGVCSRIYSFSPSSPHIRTPLAWRTGCRAFLSARSKSQGFWPNQCGMDHTRLLSFDSWARLVRRIDSCEEDPPYFSRCRGWLRLRQKGAFGFLSYPRRGIKSIFLLLLIIPFKTAKTRTGVRSHIIKVNKQQD